MRVTAFFISLLSVCEGGWLFSSTDEPAAEIIGIRGLQQSLQDKWAAGTDLHCDDGTRTFTAAQINDNYCDCADGADEPGTSACAKGTFVCANRGYRTVTISSMRVDDGVCDCADGTDEGTVVKCPNTSKAAAQRERDMIQKVTRAYQLGSAKKATLRAEFLQAKEGEVARVEPLEKDAAAQREVTDRLREARDAVQVAHDAAVTAVETRVKASVRAHLNVDHMSEFELARTLSAVFSVLQLTDDDVRSEATAAGVHTRHPSYHYTPPDHHHRDYNDEFGGADGESFPDSDPFEPTAGDGDGAGDASGYGVGAGDGSGMDGMDRALDGAEPYSESPPTPPTPCLLADHTGDPRLTVLCADEYGNDREDGNLDNVRDMLVGLLKTREIFREIMLIRGFERVHGTLDGVVDFVKQHVVQPGAGEGEEGSAPAPAPAADTCPAVFANVMVAVTTADGASGETVPVCALGETLASLHREFADLPAKDARPDDEYYEANGKLTELEDQLAAARRTKEEMDHHAAWIEFLALRDKQTCLETVDGKFTYSVCVMQKVTQREAEGGEADLGNFLSIEAHAETGGVVMHFTEGAHCWGINEPRKADVFVVCGAEDKLLSATEPSTCYYTFQMESPVACTEGFKAIHGLQ